MSSKQIHIQNFTYVIHRTLLCRACQNKQTKKQPCKLLASYTLPSLDSSLALGGTGGGEDGLSGYGLQLPASGHG